MKNKLLQITIFVLMAFGLALACKNKSYNKKILAPIYNADSLKKVMGLYNLKIDTCIAQKKFDSIYQYALAFKKAANRDDTAWAKKFIDIYAGLDTAKKEIRINLLNAIIDQENPIIDNLFNVQKVKALCNLAYEKESEPEIYVKILEKTLPYNEALNTLGVDYKNFIYQNLGESYTKLNDNKTGLQYLKLFYKTSLTLADREKRNNQIGEAALDLGNTLRNMQEYDSAIYFCILATQTPDLDKQNEALSNASLAEVYFDIGAISKAEQPALKANELLKNDTTKQNIKTKAVVFSILSEIELFKKNIDKSKKYAAQSLIYFEKESDAVVREKAKLFLTFAHIQKEQNNIDSALFFANKAISQVIYFIPKNICDLPSSKYLRPENTIYEALDFKAKLLEQEAVNKNMPNLLETAVEAYSLSFKVEQMLQQYFLNTAATDIQMQESRKRSNAAIKICYQLFNKTKNNIWAEKAFAFAEKNKSIVLLESIKRNIAANGLLQNDSNLNKSIKIQADITKAEREILETTDSNVKLENTKTIEKLQTELLFVQTTLSNQNDYFKTIIEKKDTFSIKEITSKILDNESTLVEFFSNDSSTYIFTLTKNNPITFYKLDTSINTAVNSFLTFFENKNNISNNPLAYNNLANNIFAQCRFSEINSSFDNLIIIPDGKFNFIPFEALTTSTSNATNPKTFNYLLAQKQISYNYSVGTMLKQLENESKTETNKIVAFAPVFENNYRNKSPLLNTIDELEGIKKANSTGGYFLKKDATLSNFKKEINTANIVHIATHAQADVQNTQQPQIEFYDSTLYLNELYAMHINPSLVVLSACETGKGEINKSEGAMSLARGFYYAGAKNIITSLWSVDDKSTASIFSNFYKNFSNTNYTKSLQQAKLTYLQNATATNASPYYWAGFIHIGFQPKQINHYTLLVFIALLILSTIIIYISHKRNQRKK